MRPRPRRSTKLREHRQPDGAALLGVELRGPQRPALDRGREAAAVVAPRRDHARRRRARARTCARSSTTRDRAARRAARASGRASSVFQPICGSRTVSGRRVIAAGDDAEAGDVRATRRCRRTASACRRRCRGRAGRRSRPPTVASSSPLSRKRAHARAEVADAREHDRVAPRRSPPASAVRRGVGAEVLQRLLRRTQVPDAVVDHRDRHAQLDSVPLVDGTSSPSIFTASRSARATPLNDASIT